MGRVKAIILKLIEKFQKITVFSPFWAMVLFVALKIKDNL